MTATVKTKYLLCYKNGGVISTHGSIVAAVKAGLKQSMPVDVWRMRVNGDQDRVDVDWELLREEQDC